MLAFLWILLAVPGPSHVGQGSGASSGSAAAQVSVDGALTLDRIDRLAGRSFLHLTFSRGTPRVTSRLSIPTNGKSVIQTGVYGTTHGVVVAEVADQLLEVSIVSLPSGRLLRQFEAKDAQIVADARFVAYLDAETGERLAFDVPRLSAAARERLDVNTIRVLREGTLAERRRALSRMAKFPDLQKNPVVRDLLIAGLTEAAAAAGSDGVVHPDPEMVAYWTDLGSAQRQVRDTRAVQLLAKLGLPGTEQALAAFGPGAITAIDQELRRPARQLGEQKATVLLRTLRVIEVGALSPRSVADATAAIARSLESLAAPSALREAIDAVAAFPSETTRGALRTFVAESQRQGYRGLSTESLTQLRERAMKVLERVQK